MIAYQPRQTTREYTEAEFLRHQSVSEARVIGQTTAGKKHISSGSNSAACAGQVQSGDSRELALVFDVIERTCAMHRHSVVPYDKVTFAPFMGIQEFGVRSMFHQVSDQQSAAWHIPFNDALGVGRQIQGFPAIFELSDQRVCRTR